MRPVSRKWVVYDSACGLCSAVRDWTTRQISLISIELLAADSEEASKRFGQLPPGELVVVADTGEVWLGNHAWVVCLWALRDYREWSLRFSRLPLSLMAREAYAAVSRNRLGLSGLLKIQSDRELEQQLRKVSVPTCQTEQM
jgi:predicted DCC family thiol-disulfide oxidoreductase YuxK